VSIRVCVQKRVLLALLLSANICQPYFPYPYKVMLLRTLKVDFFYWKEQSLNFKKVECTIFQENITILVSLTCALRHSLTFPLKETASIQKLELNLI
jgi:hypothetical protein